MNPEKVTEFLTVLVFAIAVGVMVALAVRFLSGNSLVVAVIAIGAVSIFSWNILRKRFRRG